MSVVLLVNPKSGRGLGLKLADRFERAIRTEGFACKRLAAIHGVDAEAGEPFRPERFAGADALVVIGGDGTISRVAHLTVRTRTPVYHVPVGNENLFARQFDMGRDPAALRVALRRRDIADTDLATLDTVATKEPFLMMASCGPDAGVVHRLTRGRTKAIGHLAYTGPTLAELARPTIPRLTVEVDGVCIVEGVRGWAVIGNGREYGMGVDIARHASVFSGKLDAVFMPCQTAAEASWWMARAKLGWHLRDRRIVYATGRRVVVRRMGGIARWQIDGEAVLCAPSARPVSAVERAVAEVQPGVLPVLRP
ncbi:MAG: diacylglycerol kinase family protein [Planctomycetota bacterium]